MPRLLIELSGTEYDRLTEYAKGLRRTPNQQAAQIIADAMEIASRPLLTIRSTEADGSPLPGALAAQQQVGPVEAGRDGP